MWGARMGGVRRIPVFSRRKVPHSVQYDLNKVQTVCPLGSKWWRRGLAAPLTSCLLCSVFCAGSCVWAMMVVNRLELMGGPGAASRGPGSVRAAAAGAGRGRGPLPTAAAGAEGSLRASSSSRPRFLPLLLLLLLLGLPLPAAGRGGGAPSGVPRGTRRPVGVLGRLCAGGGGRSAASGPRGWGPSPLRPERAPGGRWGADPPPGWTPAGGGAGGARRVSRD
uniref:Uncharacterized protein n=1 Tax=Pipistrellus kuhlii TaxID=59472 RepID=A0A7J7R2F3_PIPKU|nr:hypothetical protein mPipKuh1_007995 [Pipistrellus kuhlii]